MLADNKQKRPPYPVTISLCGVELNAGIHCSAATRYASLISGSDESFALRRNPATAIRRAAANTNRP
jgi:hypothetical protein